METLLIISWTIGLIIALSLSCFYWIEKDKDAFIKSLQFILVMILTGWFMGFISLAVLLYIFIMSRFEK